MKPTSQAVPIPTNPTPIPGPIPGNTPRKELNSDTLFTKTDRPHGFQCNVIDSDWFEKNPGTPPASDTLYVTLPDGRTAEFPVEGQELDSGHLCSTGCMMTLSSGSMILAEWHLKARCARQINPGVFIDKEGDPYSPNIQLAAMQYDDRGMGRRYVFPNGSTLMPRASARAFLHLIDELSDGAFTEQNNQEQP